jgi:hypothetical protein
MQEVKERRKTNTQTGGRKQNKVSYKKISNV